MSSSCVVAWLAEAMKYTWRRRRGSIGRRRSLTGYLRLREERSGTASLFIPYTSQLASSEWTAGKALRRLAATVSPDVVVERFYTFAGAGIWAAHALKIPAVLEVNSPARPYPGSWRDRLDLVDDHTPRGSLAPPAAPMERRRLHHLQAPRAAAHAGHGPSRR